MASFFTFHRLRREWRQALQLRPVFPQGKFQGRGLVFCAGGAVHFTNLWVNLSLIRRVLGCKLPAEVWFFGPEEMTPRMQDLLERFDVRMVDGSAHAADLPSGKDRGFALKTIAVQWSSFEEVLFLDTESHPVRDPAFLFDEPSYRWTGALFWPDVFRVNPEAGCWRLWGLPMGTDWEWETGQIVLHKPSCWRALELAAHLNFRFRDYYRMVHGDKVTYQAAWRALDQPQGMPWKPARHVMRPGGVRMVEQHDFQGRLLFQHRTMADWSLDPAAAPGRDLGFVHQEACEGFLEELRGLAGREWSVFPRRRRPGGAEAAGPLRCAEGVLWGAARPPGPQELEALPPVCSPWEAAACQVWRGPRLATMGQMAQALHALQGGDPAVQAAACRQAAVIGFLDAGLLEMLPGAGGTEGSVLEEGWEALLRLKEASRRLRPAPGWIQASSLLPPEMHNALLPESERDLLGLLGAVFEATPEAGQWNAFAALSGVRRPGRTPGSLRRPAARFPERGDRVLVLTPVKNAAGLAAGYLERLAWLDHPADRLSLGLLESDSDDGTYEVFRGLLASSSLMGRWRRTTLLQRHFDLRFPVHVGRWHPSVQARRRSVLAQSRNLLLQGALLDEDWVLWLDADVVDYPGDIIRTLLSCHKDILHPLCVNDYGGPIFDRNAWRDQGTVNLGDLKGEGKVVPLDAVGGTMLWVRADLHRRGLLFPEVPYGAGHPKARPPGAEWKNGQAGELETEGLGLMAGDMGSPCWGLPHLEILHRKG